MRKITKLFAILAFLSLATVAFATDTDSVKVAEDNQKNITKTGYNFGPFPVIGFDADKGWGFGALLNIFDFGDGSTYPNPRQQWYIEASYYTKGTQLYVVSYDTQGLIPGVRVSIAGQCLIDNALPFTGFNGYESYYDHERMTLGNADDNYYMYNPYYRVHRTQLYFKGDFTGNITPNKRFRWVAGYHLRWAKYKEYDDVNIDRFNKGLDDNKQYPNSEPTLFGQYKEWGIIPENAHDGGLLSSVRAGLVYDSRDVENNPTRGIWAEGHLIASPKWLGSTVSSYQYTLGFRHYVPIVPKKLTFAYRLNYQGSIGGNTPFYALPYFSVSGKGYDRDAIGGYHTARGILRNRVQGLDMAFYNIELRWRFIEFKLWKQNIAFALNAFTDGAATTRPYDMTFKATQSDFESIVAYNESKDAYDAYRAKGTPQDGLHVTAGGGLRFIMNENFILAAEYAVPFKKDDGNPAFYLNVGYLF